MGIVLFISMLLFAGTTFLGFAQGIVQMWELIPIALMAAPVWIYKKYDKAWWVWYFFLATFTIGLRYLAIPIYIRRTEAIVEIPLSWEDGIVRMSAAISTLAASALHLLVIAVMVFAECAQIMNTWNNGNDCVHGRTKLNRRKSALATGVLMYVIATAIRVVQYDLFHLWTNFVIQAGIAICVSMFGGHVIDVEYCKLCNKFAKDEEKKERLREE